MVEETKKSKLQEVKRRLAEHYTQADVRPLLIEARLLRRVILEEREEIDQTATFERLNARWYEIEFTHGSLGCLSWWYQLACSPGRPFADTVVQLAANSTDEGCVEWLIELTEDEAIEHRLSDVFDRDDSLSDVVRIAAGQAHRKILEGLTNHEEFEALCKGLPVPDGKPRPMLRSVN